MTALATPDELGVLLQRALSVAEAAAAAQVLESASETIRTFTRQTLSRVDNDELVVPVSWIFEMWLPERPVIDITSITIAGAAQAASAYSWYQGGHVAFPYGLSGFYGDQAVIVYSHGFDPVPADIRGICLELGRSAVVDPGGAVESEKVGSYAVTFDADAAAILTESQERRLLPYRPVITNVPITAGL